MGLVSSDGPGVLAGVPEFLPWDIWETSQAMILTPATII